MNVADDGCPIQNGMRVMSRKRWAAMQAGQLAPKPRKRIKQIGARGERQAETPRALDVPQSLRT